MGRTVAGARRSPNEIIVQFEEGTPAAARAAAVAALGGRLEEVLRGEGPGKAGEALLQRLSVAPGIAVERALEILSKQPGVAFAEPNFTYHALGTNDPAYGDGLLWGMYGDGTSPANPFGSQAAEAWASGQTGSTKVAIGVVDTGIDYTHPDLHLNVWLNQNEIPDALRSALRDIDADGLIGFRDLNASANSASVADGNGNGRIDAGDLLGDSRWENGLDEDGNGYIDDLIGWDFVNGDNDPYDDNGHGTHVAGTIAAIGGNGTGVAGVSWSSQVVALKFLAANGSGSLADAVKALDYFTDAAKASDVQEFAATNNSWGGGDYSLSLLDAISRGARQDILFIAAAGNGGADRIGDDNDVEPTYPASYDTTASVGWDAVISVASITKTGALSGFSNFGGASVDLGAPGSSILSTLAGGGYGSMSGTSMATPHVAGAVALYAAASAVSGAEIKAALLASAAPTASLAGKSVSGGRLDLSSLSSAGVTITGTAGDDIVSPSRTVAGQPLPTGRNDTIHGNGGNDRLDGGLGADTLHGGAGNDIYYADNAGDRAIEESAPGVDTGGIDLVYSSASFALGAFVENLTLTGTSSADAAGNALANKISGNAGANGLRGGDGNDYLAGNAGNDVLEGEAGNDQLNGGAGADAMRGGSGNDTYTVDDAGDSASEEVSAGVDAGGVDRVNSWVSVTLGAFVENLTLTGTGAVHGTGNGLANAITGNNAANRLEALDGNDALSGNGGDDTLFGGAGNDRLNGGLGADALYGGAGNDSYTVDHAGDIASEETVSGSDDGGIDAVSSSVSHALGAFVETLTLTGLAAIDGTGNGSNNKITGNGAANTLRGGAGNDGLSGGLGADTLYGGSGNDSYTVDNAGDVVSEQTVAGTDDGGLDVVNSAVTFTLDAFIENLALTGLAAIDAVGNGGNNRITGNNAVNTVRGGDGNDYLLGNGGADFLYGEAGTDTLSGGIGDDWLEGGAGADQLSGGTGLDTFFLFGPTIGNQDRIADFNKAEGDRLGVRGGDYGLAAGALDPGRFTANATGAADSPSGTGQFVYNTKTRTLLWDADGSGGSAGVAIATFSTLVTLGSSDFLVI